MNDMLWIALAAVVIAVAGAWWFVRVNLRGRPAALALKPGDPLPEFSAEGEDGQRLGTADLRGRPAVLLFIRGNWCPFCTRQVEDLTRYYKEITDAGARLVFVTPKPLETTRRVADLFGVDFEFWLDPDLAAAESLGLVHRAGVPGKHREDYGTDTVWPTTIVSDADGRVAWLDQSRRIVDRPDPRVLLGEIRRLG